MLVDSFLEYLRVERNYSPDTLLSYGNDLRQFEVYFANVDAELTWQTMDVDVVRQWVMTLMDDDYTATSVNRKLSALRSFYRFLLLRGLVTKNPMLKMVGPKKKKPLPVFVKEQDMDRLLDETPDEGDFESIRDHLILETFYLTGMRQAELIGLDDKDVDFSASVIKVTGKRNKQRLIPFGEELRHDVEAYIQLRNEAVPVRDSDALFVRTDGRRLYPGLVYNLVKRSLSEVVTLKKRSPHVLRHTFATSMLNHDVNLEVVKELLGHASLKTTEIYTHTSFEELKQIYKQAHPRA